jgi:hypothetical protein
MSDQLFEEYAAWVDEEIQTMAEEREYWENQGCEFDGKLK